MTYKCVLVRVRIGAFPYQVQVHYSNDGGKTWWYSGEGRFAEQKKKQNDIKNLSKGRKSKMQTYFVFTANGEELLRIPAFGITSGEIVDITESLAKKNGIEPEQVNVSIEMEGR